ncbi:hypothetical protein [Absidia glauca]|uniref:Uncharacterized protein n=1 Tax=Absidia glauca TaxID=4829 RepID=A0A163JWW6_ABSGL|nr:hypothetical protein [Absidia glauca]
MMDETRTETNGNSNTTSHHLGRVQPRRSSRSALSSSPITTTTTKDDRNGVLPESTNSTTASPSTPASDTPLTIPGTNDNDNSSSSSSTMSTVPALTANHHSRVTRSLSADSNSNEELTATNNNNSSASANTANGNGKRRRHTSNSSKLSHKKRSGASTTTNTAAPATTTATTPNTTSSTTTPPPPSSTTTSPSSISTSLSPSSATPSVKSPPRGPGNADDYERETRHTTQRLSKEAKDARKAERGIIVKKKLDELESLEQMVKDQSHEEYQSLLKEIQDKRAEKLDVAQGRHALMETHFKNGYLAQKKAAFDKFHFDKLALRRNMMNQVQQKINKIEQEYFFSQQSNKSALDDPHLHEWAPPDRPSMINILFMHANHQSLAPSSCLDEQDISQDIAELQELVPPPSQSIDDNQPLDPSKKNSLALISSS